MSSVQNPTPEVGPKKTSILSRSRLASEIPVIPKFLIAGEHGAGKTHILATAVNPFVVTFEGNQSVATVRNVNDKARIFEVKSVADWREFSQALINGELDDHDILGIDSFNEMQTYYDRDIEARMKKAQAGAAQTKDNKWAKFREMKSTMGNIFMFLRDLPMPVAATIRTKSETDDDTGITRVRFSLEGDARNNVGANFMATCYVYKWSDGAGENRRGAMFSGPENYPCRESGPLRGICEPNLAMWMEALKGNVSDKLYIQDARMPGERARVRGADTSAI